MEGGDTNAGRRKREGRGSNGEGAREGVSYRVRMARVCGCVYVWVLV